MHEEIFRDLARGATLLTVSRRLARTLTHAFHTRQRDAGRSVWKRPDVLPLDAFLERSWREWVFGGAASDGLTLLHPLQEQMLWEQVIRSSAGDSLLRVPETARSAMEAWRLVQAYRLPVDGRFEASDDWAAFAGWSREFQKRCRDNGWLERTRLGDFVSERMANGEMRRPEIVYRVGFDELTPQQSVVFEALGEPKEIGRPALHPVTARWKFPDTARELRAAAKWARALLEESPDQTIGVIVSELKRLRPKVERAFRKVLDPSGAHSAHERLFHVSLGPPLAGYPIVHAALLILDFALRGAALPQAGMLLRSPFLGGAELERSKRALVDARFRRDGVWDVSLSGLHEEGANCPLLQRALRRCEKVLEKIPDEQPPSDWSADFTRLLDALGWPGDRSLSSREYQVMEAWRDLLSDLAALDLAEPRMTFDAALARLREIASATAFQVEDEGAPVQIMDMLEASALEFDHLWIIGLHDEALPPPANPNPFLPISLQREHKLPHSSAELELDFAGRLMEQFVSSASDVVLSYPEAEGDRELSVSSLVAGGSWLAAEQGESEPPAPSAGLEEFVDDVAPEVVVDAKQVGGSSLFKDMAACHFRAFAKHRLGARPLEESNLGLSYKDRGNAVHKALQFIWSELGSHARLVSLDERELKELVERNVVAAVRYLGEGIGRRLEERRLGRLLIAWLELEKSRQPFTVIKPEEERVVSIGGLQVRTRADRVDELANGRDVILDYKTGQVSTRGWESERPDEPQLPLYCATSDRPVAGAAFAVIRTGDLSFRGLAENGAGLPGMKKISVDFEHQIAEWRRILERLALDFRAGRAEVDPQPDACEYCGLWAFCRIRESEHGRG